MTATAKLTPADAESYLASIYISPYKGRQERRGEERYATNAAATLWILGKVQGTAIDARVVDVSKSGLGLAIPAYLSDGTKLRIVMKTVTAVGYVRWCRPEGPEFRAGIALNRVVPAGGGESGPSEQGGDRAQATSSGV